MPSTARHSPRRPDPDASGVVVLRVGDPCFRGLREAYHETRRALRRVELRGDPASREQARRLERARRILLDGLVERD
jgi:hypothetical protein